MCILSTVFCDFRACGSISIPTTPIVALTEFLYTDAVSSVHPLLVSWYLISLLCVYLCSWMLIMSMLCSMADAVRSGSCPILFKVPTLNFAIWIMCLHFCNFCCFSSVADFSNTEARAPTSTRRASFQRREERCGLDMWSECGSWLSFNGYFYSHLQKPPL